MSVFRDRLQKRLGDDPQKKKFAKAAGISVRYLNALLNGERKNPSVDRAAAMALALDVSLDYLAGIERPGLMGA